MTIPRQDRLPPPAQPPEADGVTFVAEEAGAAGDRYLPLLSEAGLKPAYPVIALDEYGEAREGYIAGEQPLTLYIDKREVVTLMTLGTHPELLVLGYLRNQHLVPCLESVYSIQVDWATESVAVTTFDGVSDLDERLRHRTVTTGCGQGTVFGRVTEHLARLRLPTTEVRQSRIYALLDALSAYNEVYRRAGAVHGCALCSGAGVELFVEDVGRHNAADAIAGYMWLNAIAGRDKVFYTTGRLTSEMVVKVAQMGIPVLVSRSGITHKGLEFAQKVGVTMIARAKGQHFLVYSGKERVIFDAMPKDRGRPVGYRRAEDED
jgi:FdhD protein